MHGILPIFAAFFVAATRAAPLADASLVERFPHGQYYTDDQSSLVSYNSAGQGWTHGTGVCKYYDGTQSYNNDASASYSFQYEGGNTMFAIYGSKKHDRGLFEVLLNGKSIGQGDAYDGSLQNAGPSIKLFECDQFALTGQNNLVVVKNVADSRAGTSNGYPYMQLDFILTAS